MVKCSPADLPFGTLSASRILNVVILHCHFERGGVTQVVENQVRYLHRCDRVERVFLVSGDRVGGLSRSTRDRTVRWTIDDFDYDPAGIDDHALDHALTQQRAQSMTARITRLLRQEGLRTDDTVLHWHNHSLGKNTAAPLVVRELAKRDWAILLQIHDFAEDNRPENYRRLISASGATSKQELDRFLYPSASRIQYAGLTAGDTGVLKAMNLPATSLPNSVVVQEHSNAPEHVHDARSIDPEYSRRQEELAGQVALAKVRVAMDLPSDATWTIYPVRGIRRKNVGEWLLLCQLLPPGWYSGLTLRPDTVTEKASYQRWQQLGETVAPNAIFDAGHHEDLSYRDNLSACHTVVSTSVAEGFGMTFLEPWLVGRRVIARRLPGVTADFQQAGVDLGSFYDWIPIPGDPRWIADCISQREASWHAATSKLPPTFQPVQVPTPKLAGTIDFAWLTPKRQVEVLLRMVSDQGFAREVKSLSSRLVSDLASVPDDEKIQTNALVIAKQYSVETLGARLVGLYTSVMNGSVLGQTSPRNAPDNCVPLASDHRAATDLVNSSRPFYPCRTETFADD